MAEKKFACADGTVNASADANRDYESASVFDRVRVGKLGVYYKDGFKTKMIPYSYPERVFIRVHQVNARISCCSNSLFYFTLVFVKDGKEFASIYGEVEPKMDQALAAISANAPQIAIGYPQKIAEE